MCDEVELIAELNFGEGYVCLWEIAEQLRKEIVEAYKLPKEFFDENETM